MAPVVFPRMDRSSMLACRVVLKMMMDEMHLMCAQDASTEFVPAVQVYKTRRQLRLVLPPGCAAAEWAAFAADVYAGFERDEHDDDGTPMVELALIAHAEAGDAATVISEVAPASLVLAANARAFLDVALHSKFTSSPTTSAVVVASKECALEELMGAAQKFYTAIVVRHDALGVEFQGAAAATLFMQIAYENADTETEELVPDGLDAATGRIVGSPPVDTTSNTTVLRQTRLVDSYHTRRVLVVDELCGIGAVTMPPGKVTPQTVRDALLVARVV